MLFAIKNRKKERNKKDIRKKSILNLICVEISCRKL